MTKDNSDLARRRARLTPEQRRRLKQRYQIIRSRTDQTFPILRRQASDPTPVSYAQHRHWFLWQLDPQSTAYHLNGVLHLLGELDVDALRSSFQMLVRRHESLRTVFRINAEGLPEQIIESESKFELTVLNLSDLPAAHRDGRVREEAIRINTTPFDLTRGPLLRVALIQVAPAEHHLVVVMHHIISDAWSNRIVIDEFAACYRSHIEGQLLCLPALPVQYADYAQWQRNWLEAGEKKRQLIYWRNQLGEEQPVLQLPTDHARSSNSSYQAAQYAFTLPGALVARLQCRAQDQSATLFMVLLAGFQVLLYRYTGQSDIRVGIPIANRHRVEIENVVGLFVNTQVMRNMFDSRMPLSVILKQVREAALGAQAYQDLPFEELVEALQPERSLNQNPLFQVMFNHYREDYRALAQLPGLTVEEFQLSERDAQLELTLDIVEKPDARIDARFTYAAELFETDTVKRLSEHYLLVLEQLADKPQKCVGDIALLSAAEWRQLKGWGVNERCYADSEPVHRQFERQVSERPDATALIFGDTELSYAALNQRSNRLAHRLIALGIKAETRVGIAVERSIGMIVGLLATLKAGGAYVPLDTNYPQDRLNYMAMDSGIEVLLTQSHITERISLPVACEILALDRLDLTRESERNPNITYCGEQLAYIIYTSGSTGKPKGVCIRHHALAHFIMSMLESPGLEAGNTLISVTAFSFDIAGLEIYLPLSAGARLVLAPWTISQDGPMLVRLLNTYRPDVFQSTPAGWRVLLAAGWKGSQAGNAFSLKCLCGGEALSIDLVDQLQALNVELWNMYGPTETTIWSIAGEINQREALLGTPIAATRLYILDAEMNPVSCGMPGELYLGGVGLARGYYNKPALTAHRFIADPFSENGERLYRTGDLVRWQSGGRIEYLGRLDHQIKIRGFRIELGEIEAQLSLQPQIREAVVVTIERLDSIILVAYICCQPGSNVDTTELRDTLAKSLPDYMIPSAIVILESLPLNASGKVDRKMLPEPEFINAAQYEAPQGEVEEALAAIWMEVLNLSRVGRQDHFFELGGHSLLILQVQQKLQSSRSISLPLRIFFEHPVLQDIAATIQANSSASSDSRQLDEMSALLDLLEN
jgi:amino acid adenylation domain-containing protein